MDYICSVCLGMIFGLLAIVLSYCVSNYDRDLIDSSSITITSWVSMIMGISCLVKLLLEGEWFYFITSGFFAVMSVVIILDALEIYNSDNFLEEYDFLEEEV